MVWLQPRDRARPGCGAKYQRLDFPDAGRLGRDRQLLFRGLPYFLGDPGLVGDMFGPFARCQHGPVQDFGDCLVSGGFRLRA